MSENTQTLVRKITIGTPIRRVVGAEAQRLDDLLDVQIRDLEDDHILQYEASSGLWKNRNLISGGTF
tara:strand:+ start:11288 stop:11488 length:201 start_codon:yes stop_codon:yes gene_type:complete